jgi:hypothetical protein
MQADFKEVLKIREGQKAPDFTLPNATGKAVIIELGNTRQIERAASVRVLII